MLRSQFSTDIAATFSGVAIFTPFDENDKGAKIYRHVMSSDISVQSNQSSIIARTGIAKSIIEMEATNSYGRVFENGKALSNDLRHLVIKNLERSGANCQLGNVPWGVFTKVSTELCISVTTVSKVWNLERSCFKWEYSEKTGVRS